MKKLVVLLMAVTLFYACEKETEGRDPSVFERQRVERSVCERQMVERSVYERQMVERFKKDLKCTEKNVMEVNLYMGLYRNEHVYFTMIMCPACNTIPPTNGYTCDNRKVDFDDFNNVKNIQEIYNSCTKEFKKSETTTR